MSETAKEFSFRSATLDDLSALARIEQEVQRATWTPWSEDAFAGELEKPYSQTLLLTDDETDSMIAGYIVFWLMMDECQILNIAVDPNHQRRGYGRILLRKAISLAVTQGLKRAILHVRRSNAPAIQLYQNVGFSTQHVRKSFYSDGEDAYEMVLELDGAQVLRFE